MEPDYNLFIDNLLDDFSSSAKVIELESKLKYYEKIFSAKQIENEVLRRQVELFKDRIMELEAEKIKPIECFKILSEIPDIVISGNNINPTIRIAIFTDEPTVIKIQIIPVMSNSKTKIPELFGTTTIASLPSLKNAGNSYYEFRGLKVKAKKGLYKFKITAHPESNEKVIIQQIFTKEFNVYSKSKKLLK